MFASTVAMCATAVAQRINSSVSEMSQSFLEMDVLTRYELDHLGFIDASPIRFICLHLWRTVLQYVGVNAHNNPCLAPSLAPSFCSMCRILARYPSILSFFFYQIAPFFIRFPWS